MPPPGPSHAAIDQLRLHYRWPAATHRPSHVPAPAAATVMPRCLVLIPTELERRVIQPRLEGRPCRVELCGFGMVVAAARTARWVADIKPERVILVGIAGAYGDGLPVGTAWRFDRVGCHGVGAGDGDAFVSAAALGWPQWPGQPGGPATAIGDVIECAPAPEAGAESADLLLSVTAASADAAGAARRQRASPGAVAEDMEGFGVAAACRLAGVPLTIVRGISNVAGVREKSMWRTTEAADAAASLAARLVAVDA